MNDSNKGNSWELGGLSTNAAGGVIVAENAVVDSVFTNNRTGYVTITYGIMDNRRTLHMQVVTLVIGRNTVIRDQFGNKIGLRNLRKDMVVNARFSSAMTRSIPPQSRAFRIIVVKENKSSLIQVGRVLSVERDNNFGYILTGNANDIYSQIRFVISNTTKLRDRRGNRISIRDIRPGQTVRIERASFETASIPPQTSALTVQIISN